MPAINLTPWRELQRQRLNKRFIRSFIISISIVVICLLMNYGLNRRALRSQKKTNTHLAHQLTSINQRLNKLREIKKQYQQAEKQLGVFGSLNVENKQSLQLINEMVDIVPLGLYLQSLQRKDKSIILQGKARSQQPVLQLVQNITAARVVSKPEVLEVKTHSEDKAYPYYFVLRMQQAPIVNRKEAKNAPA